MSTSAVETTASVPPSAALQRLRELAREHRDAFFHGCDCAQCRQRTSRSAAAVATVDHAVQLVQGWAGRPPTALKDVEALAAFVASVDPLLGGGSTTTPNTAAPSSVVNTITADIAVPLAQMLGPVVRDFIRRKTSTAVLPMQKDGDGGGRGPASTASGGEHEQAGERLLELYGRTIAPFALRALVPSSLRTPESLARALLGESALLHDHGPDVERLLQPAAVCAEWSAKNIAFLVQGERDGLAEEAPLAAALKMPKRFYAILHRQAPVIAALHATLGDTVGTALVMACAEGASRAASSLLLRTTPGPSQAPTHRHVDDATKIAFCDALIAFAEHGPSWARTGYPGLAPVPGASAALAAVGSESAAARLCAVGVDRVRAQLGQTRPQWRLAYLQGVCEVPTPSPPVLAALQTAASLTHKLAVIARCVPPAVLEDASLLARRAVAEVAASVLASLHATLDAALVLEPTLGDLLPGLLQLHVDALTTAEHVEECAELVGRAQDVGDEIDATRLVADRCLRIAAAALIESLEHSELSTLALQHLEGLLGPLMLLHGVYRQGCLGSGSWARFEAACRAAATALDEETRCVAVANGGPALNSLLQPPAQL